MHPSHRSQSLLAATLSDKGVKQSVQKRGNIRSAKQLVALQIFKFDIIDMINRVGRFLVGVDESTHPLDASGNDT